jgi:hypothetical protein
MNIPNLIKTRDAIERYASRFDYTTFTGAWREKHSSPFECDTIGCVAGFAVAVLDRPQVPRINCGTTDDIIVDIYELATTQGLAGQLLDLMYDEMTFLFYPSDADNNSSLTLLDFDHTDAVDRLNWLIDGKAIEDYVIPPRKDRVK